MTIRSFLLAIVGAIATCAVPQAAIADTVQARCDIYPLGEDRATAIVPCTFSQRQGVAGIQLPGRRYDVIPVDEFDSRYVDQYGQEVRREDDLGNLGIIFRFRTESIYVYWNTDGIPNRQPTPSHPERFSEEVSCRIADESINVLKNSRGELIFQGQPDLIDETIVVGHGRIVRGNDYLDRIFDQPGFRHTLRTLERDGRLVHYYITQRNGQLLDTQMCYPN